MPCGESRIKRTWCLLEILKRTWVWLENFFPRDTGTNSYTTHYFRSYFSAKAPTVESEHPERY